MTDKEFEKLEEEIRETAIKLAALQDKYKKETGKYLFVYLPLDRWQNGGKHEA